MSEHTIEITNRDAQRLREWLAYLTLRPGADRATRVTLRHKLDRALVVPSNRVGRSVVTLQSRVESVDDETWESRTYTLVHPEQASQDGTSLSVLTPMGMAILGHREGDAVEWEGPSGSFRIWLRKVLYQPEAAGHEHMKHSAPREARRFTIPRGHPAPAAGSRRRKSPTREGCST